MAGTKLLQRIERRYGQQIADLFGVKRQPVTFGLGHLGGNAAEANADAGTVTFDRGWLKGASRADIRGAAIHELTHAYRVGYGKSSERVETLADYARYTLNPNEASYWKPSAEVLRMAERRGTMAASGTAGNGPKNGNNNRNRDTVVNKRSKTDPRANTPPPVSPGSSANYAAQQAQLRLQLTNQLSQLRAQAGLVRGQYRTDLGAVRAQRVADTVGAEANALERGVTGSSFDLEGRAAAVTNAASARLDARSRRNLALMDLRQQGMQARTGYITGVQGIQHAQAAEQAEAAAAELQQNAFDAMEQNYQQMYQDILKRLMRSGRKRPPVGTGVPLQPYLGQYSGKTITPRMAEGYFL